MDDTTSAQHSRGGSLERAAGERAVGQGGTAQRNRMTEKDKGEVRFEVHDPTAEVTYRFPSSHGATEKAQELGCTRIQEIRPDGSKEQINLRDGAWLRQDGSTLAAPKQLDAPSPERSNVIPLQATAQVDQAAQEAERSKRVAELQAALLERYVIKRPTILEPLGTTEYRFRGDTLKLAFTETATRLATETDNPSVARSMVDLAEARGWKGFRLTGTEEFRRLVWLESTLRGMRSVGYEPQLADLQLLAKERASRQANRLDRTAAPAEGGKPPSSRGGGARRAVLATLEAVLREKGVSPTKTEVVMAAAEERLAQLHRAGRAPKVQVYDAQAPSRAPRAAPPRTPQRTQEQAGHVR